jgi:hypothetical protein
MSEAVFGGEGVKPRTEYDILKGSELLEEATAASVALDYFLEANTSEVISSDTTASASREMTERNLNISYMVFDKSGDDFLVFDTESKGIRIVEATSTSYEKNVTLHYTRFHKGPVMEEYYVSFERYIPYTTVPFVHTYLFEFIKGSLAHVTVQANNIDVDDGIEGAMYERQVTAYDLAEFYKELQELNEHITAGITEQAAVRRLTQ